MQIAVHEGGLVCFEIDKVHVGGWKPTFLLKLNKVLGQSLFFDGGWNVCHWLLMLLFHGVSKQVQVNVDEAVTFKKKDQVGRCAVGTDAVEIFDERGVFAMPLPGV